MRTVISVRDSLTGTIKTYTNPQGAAFQPIQDTGAFATCRAPGQPPPADAPAEVECRDRRRAEPRPTSQAEPRPAPRDGRV